MNNEYKEWTYWYHDGIDKDVPDLYIVSPNRAVYWHSDNGGRHWKEHLGIVDRETLQNTGFAELYFDDGPISNSFIAWMDTKQRMDYSMSKIHFLYKEQMTKSKGLQAYLYAYPVKENEAQIALIAHYMKWVCDTPDHIDRGIWSEPSTDTLDVPKLIKKGFQVLEPNETKDMIGKDGILAIYEKFGVCVENAHLEKSDRFKNLL